MGNNFYRTSDAYGAVGASYAYAGASGTPSVSTVGVNGNVNIMTDNINWNTNLSLGKGAHVDTSLGYNFELKNNSNGSTIGVEPYAKFSCYDAKLTGTNNGNKQVFGGGGALLNYRQTAYNTRYKVQIGAGAELGYHGTVKTQYLDEMQFGEPFEHNGEMIKFGRNWEKIEQNKFYISPKVTVDVIDKKNKIGLSLEATTKEFFVRIGKCFKFE